MCIVLIPHQQVLSVIIPFRFWIAIILHWVDHSIKKQIERKKYVLMWEATICWSIEATFFFHSAFCLFVCLLCANKSIVSALCNWQQKFEQYIQSIDQRSRKTHVEILWQVNGHWTIKTCCDCWHWLRKLYAIISLHLCV